jgi:hypothetical protein
VATRPHVWQIVRIDAEGARELLGLQTTPNETPPEIGDTLDVDETSFRVVGIEPVNPDAPHVGPQRIDGIIVVMAQPSDDRAERHREAAKTHDEAAERHARAAQQYAEQGRPEEAELERRNVEIERAAAELERDRADFHSRQR